VIRVTRSRISIQNINIR